MPYPAWLPQQVNTGPWSSHYTADELERRLDHERVILPICSVATPSEQMEELGPLVLPPLFREALDTDLKSALLARIEHCFPYLHGSRRRLQAKTNIEIVEIPAQSSARRVTGPRILAFSVDPAVEEHGPHLPLATDRIQSYAVLAKLAAECSDLALAPPLDYGHLTWGLPRGLSIDTTPELLVRYVAGCARALADRYQPEALYVVDVHGSPVHRRAIQDGLAAAGISRWMFRWLHEPLVEFAAERGDQHAGAVETAVMEAIDPGLLDARWWPSRKPELAAGEMSFELAIELQADLSRFIEFAETHPWNGIVGRIENYPDLDGAALLERMVIVARQDIGDLLASG
jgi:creatinine amidohydrolase/Fe(II)-dependent formamide hydrolase-like protein